MGPDTAMARGADAARWASSVLVVLCVAFAVEPLLAGVATIGALSRVGLLAALVIFCVALGHVVRRGPTAGKPWSLVVAGVLGIGMFVRFGPDLVALPALIAGTAGFLLTRVRAAAVVVIVLGFVATVLVGRGVDPLGVVELTGRAMVLMVVIWAAGTIVVLAAEVERHRAERVRLAVAEERVRFSRDLHDLLGQSLSAISLRGELATRLVHDRPDDAVREIDGVVAIARTAATEMRGLVEGYRAQSLESEIDGALSVLVAAGITADADPVPPDVAPEAGAVLSWVLREAVTNVLRHSAATRCAITFRPDAGALALAVVNDRPRPAGHEPGHGLAGLAERLAAVGGELDSGRTAAGDFRLQARVPAVGGAL